MKNQNQKKTNVATKEETLLTVIPIVYECPKATELADSSNILGVASQGTEDNHSGYYTKSHS